ncbi:unnamed protein product [Alopecurus aequalis]
MSAQVAPSSASEKSMTTMAAAWPYVEYMARRRRQLFLRTYHHFSRDADHHLSPRARTHRVVWAGARRLRRAVATGLRRLRLCFGWAAPALCRRSSSHRAGRGFRYGRLPRVAAGKAAPASAAASVCFW